MLLKQKLEKISETSKDSAKLYDKDIIEIQLKLLKMQMNAKQLTKDWQQLAINTKGTQKLSTIICKNTAQNSNS
jgi:hypothetical protein